MKITLLDNSLYLSKTEKNHAARMADEKMRHLKSNGDESNAD